MKAFSVYYAIERKTGKYVCMGIGGAEDKHKLKGHGLKKEKKNGDDIHKSNK